jgi:integrase
LERTSVPGVYRRGRSYVAVFRGLDGRQRKRSAPTLAEARAIRETALADVRRGTFRDYGSLRFADHWPVWIDRYVGRTTRGFRDTTRSEYRRDLARYADPWFDRTRLTAIDAPMVKRYLGSLADRGLTAATVRRIYAPLRALLADAAEDGLIPVSPATGVRIPAGARNTQPRRKALTTTEAQALVRAIPARHRLLVEFLLVTGVRWSEAAALVWGDIDPNRRTVHIARRDYRGLDAPKSRHGIRHVPLSAEMAQRLAHARREGVYDADEDPVFANDHGHRLDYSNFFRRVFRPAVRSTGLEHGGAHRLRHACASHLHAKGATAAEIARWLGHASPDFTLRTYVSAPADTMPSPAALDELLAPATRTTP